MPVGQAHWRRAACINSDAEERHPIICLHMMPKSSRSFANLLPELCDQRVAIAPDLPGYGASDSLEGPASIEAYASWLWEFLDQTLPQSQAVNLLGYHTGSMIAVEAAAQQPERVNRIINISAPLFSAAEVAELGSFFQPIRLDESGTRFRVMWERIMKFRGPNMNLEMCAASLCDNLLGGEAYEDGHQAAFEHAPRYAQLLAQIPHEILVMNIADDLQAVTRRSESLLRNGSLQEHADWGNGFLELHAVAVARKILRFFDHR